MQSVPLQTTRGATSSFSRNGVPHSSVAQRVINRHALEPFQLAVVAGAIILGFKSFTQTPYDEAEAGELQGGRRVALKLLGLRHIVVNIDWYRACCRRPISAWLMLTAVTSDPSIQ